MALARILIQSMTVCGLLFSAACANKPSYSTFEDCILTNVKANQSREAVLAIREACRAKFPSRQPTQSEIESAQRAADAAAQAADAAAQAADAASQSR